MKEIRLDNSRVQASFTLKGAEVNSFILDGREYIWQADPEIWSRHTPVLFPIVGRLKDNTYFVDGKAYHLSQHGFARDSEFKLIEQTSRKVVFLLESDPETLKAYPFSFQLYISYTLEESSLKVEYKVKNPGETTMLFGIGGHPALNCPLDPAKETFEDYEMDFHTDDSEKEIYLLDGTLLGLQKDVLSLNRGKKDLTYSLFEKDALIFDTDMPSKISVKSKKSGHGFSMEYGDFRWLGVWTKGEGAGFICLEPWNGIADRIDHDQDFSKKLGINSLNPGEEYRISYTMGFF